MLEADWSVFFRSNLQTHTNITSFN